ncbi:MAG: hypothetical protein ACTHMA_01240 [Thermomicrobiales bacterium]
MRQYRFLVSMTITLMVLLGLPMSALAKPAQGGPQTLIIGVDHADPANQQPDKNRFIEYTDFFSRNVSVHRGDTLDFQTAPGTAHAVALAKSEDVARSTYPLAVPDGDDPHLAPGTGLPKFEVGPSFFPISGGTVAFGAPAPVCGVPALQQADCAFTGGADVEAPGVLAGVNPTTGVPGAVDWRIQINAAPGTYDYFCYIHPGMRGTVTVVNAGDTTTTQQQIDGRSQGQFASDRDAALAAESAANVVQFTGGAPGTRTYQVHVGLSAANNHVAILEMLPNTPLHLTQGDKVQYLWLDPHEAHTVGFPTDGANLPEDLGFDCGASFVDIDDPPCFEPGATQPEIILDPGTSPAGTALTNPAAVVDSGVLFGTGYGFQNATQQWAISTNGATQAGTYNYQCTIHDFMHGTIIVGP